MTSPFTKLGAYIWRLFETDGVPSSGKHKPKKEEIITWATEMENLLSDAPSRVGMQYKFDDDTDASIEPDDGYLKFNITSPSPEGVTQIVISDVDKFGLSYANLLADMDNSTTLPWRATIIIREAAGDFSGIFRVNGDSVINPNSVTFNVEWVDSTGTFTGEADLGVIMVPTGNTGGSLLALAIFDTGGPVGGEILWRGPVPKATTFLADLTESAGTCVALPTADATFTFWHAPYDDPLNLTQFASATFAAGERVPTFTCAADEEFATFDILEVRAPSPADATLSQPSFTLVGHLAE